jgi:TonB family protein
MFEQSIVVGTGRTRRPWTVPVSFCGQVAAVGLLVLCPLIFTEKLPGVRLLPKPVTAPVRLGTWRPDRGTVVQVVAVGRERRPGIFVPPDVSRTTFRPGIDIPVQPAMQADALPPCVGACGQIGDPQGVLVGGVDPLLERRALPPRPEVDRRVTERASGQAEPPRIKVGGRVQEARLILRVTPVYPRLAVIARISGAVELAAVIGTDGRVRELRILSGHPLLRSAAVDAVRQWVYRPTRLNDNAVEVDTSIVVTFTLGASS